MKVKAVEKENSLEENRKLAMKASIRSRLGKHPSGRSDDFKLHCAELLGTTRTVTTLDLVDVINYSTEANKSTRKVTGWFTVILTNCGENTDESIQLAIQYVILPVQLEMFDFKRHHAQGVAQFLVDNELCANRLKRLKSNVHEIYTNYHFNIHVQPGLPVTATNCHFSSELLRSLKDTLTARYDCDTKTLDLTRFHAATELRGQFCALNAVAMLKRTLKMLSEEFESCEVLRLTDNYLCSLVAFQDIAQSLPALRLLDLSFNKIEEMGELSYLNSMRLDGIVLTGNKIGFAKFKELQALLPELQEVNGCPMQSINFAPQPLFSFSTGGLNFASTFIKIFCEIYDRRPQSAHDLQSYYCSSAMFSLSASPDLLDIYGYNLYNRNQKTMKSQIALMGKLQVGREQICHALQRLPQTKHLWNKIQLDVHSYSDRLGIFSMTGKFEELTEFGWQQRGFHRFFVLKKEQSGTFLVSNDMLIVFPTADEKLHSRTSLTPSPTRSLAIDLESDVEELSKGMPNLGLCPNECTGGGYVDEEMFDDDHIDLFTNENEILGHLA